MVRVFYKGGLATLRIVELFKNLTDGKEQTGSMQFVRLHKTYGPIQCS